MAGASYKLETGQGKLGNLLDDAFSDVETVATEVREWADSLESSGLDSTDRYSRLTEAADEMEQHTQAPTIPAAKDGETDLSGLDITYVISKPKSRRRSPSRQVQLENAVAIMSAVVETLNEIAEDDERAEELRDEIQDHIDELEGVEIPGMYG